MLEYSDLDHNGKLFDTKLEELNVNLEYGNNFITERAIRSQKDEEER